MLSASTIHRTRDCSTVWDLCLCKGVGAVAMVLVTLGAAATQASTPSEPYFLEAVSISAPPSGAAGLCRTYSWACTTGAGRVDQRDSSMIARVNRIVNRDVRTVSDFRQFNRREHWSLPTARGGDCEDFALLKKQMLIQLGLPPQALLIATVLDRNRRGHAVLVVRTTAGDMVLDNQTNRIKLWSDTGYIFLRMQDPTSPKGWVSLIGG